MSGDGACTLLVSWSECIDGLVGIDVITVAFISARSFHFYLLLHEAHTVKRPLSCGAHPFSGRCLTITKPLLQLGGLSIANAPFGQATKIPTSRDDLALPMEQLGLGPAQTSDEDWDYIARNPVVATMAKENSMEASS